MIDKQVFARLVNESEREGIRRYVVGAVIAKDHHILLLERKKNDFMGGVFELPSGEVEGSESLDDALGREIMEETGLRVKDIKEYLGCFDYISRSREKTRQFNFAVIIEGSLEIRLREHASYVWVSRDELHQYQVTESVQRVLNFAFQKEK